MVSPILSISDVHLCKVCNVAQKDVDFNSVIQTRSGFFQHCLQVCNALVLGRLLAVRHVIDWGIGSKVEIVETILTLTVHVSTSASSSLFVAGSLGS